MVIVGYGCLQAVTCSKQNGNEVGKRQVEGQTIIINQQERRSTNGLGTAGFILALLGLIFSWVPGLGWVL